MQLAPLHSVAPPAQLDRLRGALDRVLVRAAALEAPLQALRPGPVDATSGPLLGAILLGAARAAESVITITQAARRLRDAGELPPGIVGTVLRFEAVDSGWTRARAYLAGVSDAGVVPGFGADMLWDGIPALVWETQHLARAAIAALDA